MGTIKATVETMLGKKFSEASLDELNALLTKIGSEEHQERQLNKKLSSLVRARITVLRKRLGQDVERFMPETTERIDGLPEIPQIPSRKNPIGDVSLLLTRVSTAQEPFSNTLIAVALDLIERTRGFMPSVMRIEPMANRNEKDEGKRMVVRWELPRAILPQELFGIHAICEDSYNTEVGGFRRKSGWKNVENCIGLDGNYEKGCRGIFFGPSRNYSASSIGVMASRRFSSASAANYLIDTYPMDWLAREIVNSGTAHARIELRDGVYSEENQGLRQEKFLSLVVRIAFLLACQKLPESRRIMIEIYRALSRIGFSSVGEKDLYGFESILHDVERILLLPFQHQRRAKMYGIVPESFLLTGVPGVGKTVLFSLLMRRPYNVIFVPVSAIKLHDDLKKEASAILLNIDRISGETELPVVFIIDDMEMLVSGPDEIVLESESIVSTLLNLMQGLRDRGVLVMGSTNKPEEVDSRLLEPGRLSTILQIRLPKQNDRKGVLSIHLRKIPFVSEGEKESIIDWLASETEGYTQRRLWELCQAAGRACAVEDLGETILSHRDKEPVGPLKRRHFKQALEEMKKTFDPQKFIKRDEEIARFISSYRGPAGFTHGKKE